MSSKSLVLLGTLALASLLRGQADPATAADPAVPATDPAYKLNSGDRIALSVFGEPDLAAQQIVDRDGRVRFPLIGEVVVVGRTVRESETLVETMYRRADLLRDPQATLTVVAYAPREVTLLGAVRSPGTFQFPPNVTSLDIRDVIARQGGFTPVAKGDAVAVTRRQASGRETTVVVDVERLMFGRGRNHGNDETFFIQPGDRIYVPERLF